MNSDDIDFAFARHARLLARTTEDSVLAQPTTVAIAAAPSKGTPATADDKATSDMSNMVSSMASIMAAAHNRVLHGEDQNAEARKAGALHGVHLGAVQPPGAAHVELDTVGAHEQSAQHPMDQKDGNCKSCTCEQQRSSSSSSTSMMASNR